MRVKLADMCADADTLAAGLKENGSQHRRYKLYTSMERALGILVSGNMYFSNGSRWNDLQDRQLMARSHQYGGCFSWSTVENIAMWMLYGGEGGKKGAMLDFPQRVMLEMLKTKSLEIGSFQENAFVPAATVTAGRDFTINLTDVVYSQLSTNGEKATLTMGDEHVVVPTETLGHPDIFHKYYAWAYERECRLVIHISEHVQAEMGAAAPVARLRLSDAAVREMKDHLYRSPVFEGSCDLGKPSKLYRQVDWRI